MKSRVECSHRPPCPGCPRLGEARPSAAALARLERLCTALGAPPPEVVTGPGPGYRHRVRLSVRGRSSSPKIGIFQEGTHHLVDIPRCVVHHPLVNLVTERLKQAIKLTRTAPYSDSAHAGLLRAVQVVVEHSTDSAQVVLVANDESPRALEPLLGALAEGLGSRLHSLWWNGNPERSNRLLGPLWHKHVGADAIEDVMGGAQVFFPPDAFGQANPPMAERIVSRIHSWVPAAVGVLELYAGVGAIGLGLLAKGCTVQFNELGAGSLLGLQLGIAALSGGGETRASVLAGPAEGALAEASPAEVVIVDPPRKGLGPEVCRGLLRAPPERLIYLSCGLDSFEREALELGETFRLEKVVGYDLFPFTEHVETLALFRRA